MKLTIQIPENIFLANGIYTGTISNKILTIDKYSMEMDLPDQNLIVVAYQKTLTLTNFIRLTTSTSIFYKFLL